MPHDVKPLTRRLLNWDLLRTLTMFLVVVVHMSSYLGELRGYDPNRTINTFALICDPVFFTLSGYFALRPLKTSLKKYYYKKISTIILPVVVYSVLLYAYSTSLRGMSLQGFIHFAADAVSNG